MNHEFEYTGTIREGESVNVGFKGNNVEAKGAEAAMSVVMDIETWRNVGDAQSCVRVKGAEGKTVHVGNGEVHDLTLTEGKRPQPDAYKMDKELQSALPSAAKSEAMQMKPRSAVAYEVKNTDKREGLSMSDVRVESDMNKKGDDALLNGVMGASVDFEGWPRVAAGGLDDGGAGLQRTLGLSVVDHGLGDPVLDGSGRIEVLELGVDVCFKIVILYIVGQFEQRCASDDVRDLLVQCHK